MTSQSSDKLFSKSMEFVNSKNHKMLQYEILSRPYIPQKTNIFFWITACSFSQFYQEP